MTPLRDESSANADAPAKRFLNDGSLSAGALLSEAPSMRFPRLKCVPRKKYLAQQWRPSRHAPRLPPHEELLEEGSVRWSEPQLRSLCLRLGCSSC